MSIGYLENTRSGCALQGALATVQAIEGIVPIIHSTSGCGVQYQNGIVPFGGQLPVLASEGPAISSTNIAQKHIVFGGGSRLREQLKNTVKIVDADLFFVLTGCATDMVGDDVKAMTREGTDQGFPAVYANTPGFSGAVHRGYQQVTQSLVSQLPSAQQAREKQSRLVNLWGIVPQHDPYWQGHLRQIAELLQLLNVHVNTLIGQGSSVEAWGEVSAASLNLVFSEYGREAATLLEGRFQSSTLHFDRLPIGEAATIEFLRKVGESLQIPSEEIDQVTDKIRAEFTTLLQSIRNQYYRYGFQREVAIVGEASLVIALQEFLSGSLGVASSLVVVTDPSDEEGSEIQKHTAATLKQNGAEKVVFLQDAGLIEQAIRESNVRLVLGSSLEKRVANELQLPWVPISFPIADRLILRKGFVGFEGAATLIESIGDAILVLE